MRRREVLRLAAALAGLPLLSGCERVLRLGVPLRLNRPGMAAGHRLRGGMTPPPPRDERRCRVAIVGSGVAGLFAAWRLRKEGFDDMVVLDGPEPDGNAAAGASAAIATQPAPTICRCPRWSRAMCASCWQRWG
ncbi:FAD-dependent oxidoreductase [Chromobacterium haemolyticum]|uniref:FAD-dependent oxidoreductase n=1 Tax=Chromobacterium haemolyticum TaxID=394935 RepID=UPI001964E2BE|nr:FAD-dependent oxidoreductase [Chromobacterium haemolyticum]